VTAKASPGITLFDYGVGNLHSISKALELGGAKVRVASMVEDVLEAKAIVFPGVGDFGAVMNSIGEGRTALRKLLLDGVPALGVCIGFQVLFDTSEEADGSGLGFFRGAVERFKGVRVPHMGWNSVELTAAAAKDPVLKGIPDGSHFYYANSYAPAPEGADGTKLGMTDYGRRFPAVMRKVNVYGTQFHPEKSGPVGLKLIANFVRFAAKEGIR